MKNKISTFLIIIFILIGFTLNSPKNSYSSGFPVFDFNQLIDQIQSNVQYGWEKITSFANQTLNTSQNTIQTLSALSAAKQAYDLCISGNAQNTLVQKGVLKNTVTDLNGFVNDTSLKNAANSTLANIQSQIKNNGNIYGTQLQQSIVNNVKNAGANIKTFTLPSTILEEICNSDNYKNRIKSGEGANIKPVNFAGTGYASVDDICQKNQTGAALNNQTQSLLISLYKGGYAGPASRLDAQNPLNSPEGQKQYQNALLSSQVEINKQIQQTLATNNGGVTGLLSCVNTKGEKVSDSARATDPNNSNNACAKIVQDAVTSGLNQYTSLLQTKLGDAQDVLKAQAAGALIGNICPKTAASVALSSGLDPNSKEYRDLMDSINAQNAADLAQAKGVSEKYSQYDPNSSTNLLTKFQQYLKAFQDVKSLEENKIDAYKSVLALTKMLDNHSVSKEAYTSFINNVSNGFNICPNTSLNQAQCGTEISYDGDRTQSIQCVSTKNFNYGGRFQLSCDGGRGIILDQNSITNQDNIITKYYLDNTVKRNDSYTVSSNNKSVTFLYDQSKNPLWAEVLSFMGGYKSSDTKSYLSESISTSTNLISHYQDNINRLQEIITYIEKAKDQKLSDTYKYDDLVKEGDNILTNITNIQSKWSLSSLPLSEVNIGQVSPYSIVNLNTEYGQLLNLKLYIMTYIKSMPDYNGALNTLNSNSTLTSYINRMGTTFTNADFNTVDKFDLYNLLKSKSQTNANYDSDGNQISGGFKTDDGLGSGGGSESACYGVGLGNLLCLAAKGKCFVAPWLRGC